MQKFAVSKSHMFVKGCVCPVQKQTETHIPDGEPFRVVHRKASHRIGNNFKTNGLQDKLNSKRTELITIVGYACKVIAKNNLRNIGRIDLAAESYPELFLYSEDE